MIKKCFVKNLTFDKMLMAHERAKKSKMSRYEVLDFEFNLENYIVNLVEKIRNNQYRLGQYRELKYMNQKSE